MSVTSHDVARLAGVSQPTVSRALRGDPRVARSTRERVVEAAAALGYVTSELGRSLKTRATRQIAMVADLENPLYPVLVPALHDAFAGHGYRMVLLAERGDDMDTYARLLDRSVDGAVLTTSLLRSSLPLRLSEQGLPFVQLNRTSELVTADAVTADNEAGGALAARFLLDLGHEKVGAIFGPEETSTARDRERGFRSVLDAAAIPMPSDWVRRGWYGYEDGRRQFLDLMSRATRPTAVFCVNDHVAIGALNAAIEVGIDVPGDVSVLGFDDLAMASWAAFRLTSVRVNFGRMAHEAAEMLVYRLTGSDSNTRQQSFPVELVERATHAPPSR
jgi:LacI family transcriptional regulator